MNDDKYYIEKLLSITEKNIEELQRLKGQYDKQTEQHVEIIVRIDKILDNTKEIQSFLEKTTNKEILEEVKSVIPRIEKVENFYKLIAKILGVIGIILVFLEVVYFMTFGKINYEKITKRVLKKIESTKGK